MRITVCPYHVSNKACMRGKGCNEWKCVRIIYVDLSAMSCSNVLSTIWKSNTKASSSCNFIKFQALILIYWVNDDSLSSASCKYMAHWVNWYRVDNNICFCCWKLSILGLYTIKWCLLLLVKKELRADGKFPNSNEVIIPNT